VKVRKSKKEVDVTMDDSDDDNNEGEPFDEAKVCSFGKIPIDGRLFLMKLAQNA